MHKEFETYEERIPTWALGYIINGDSTNLTDEEVAMIDKFIEDAGYEIISPIHYDSEGNKITSAVIDVDYEYHEYFSSCPAFGLPCEVIDCDCLVRTVEL